MNLQFKIFQKVKIPEPYLAITTPTQTTEKIVKNQTLHYKKTFACGLLMELRLSTLGKKLEIRGEPKHEYACHISDHQKSYSRIKNYSLSVASSLSSVICLSETLLKVKPVVTKR